MKKKTNIKHKERKTYGYRLRMTKTEYDNLCYAQKALNTSKAQIIRTALASYINAIKET